MQLKSPAISLCRTTILTQQSRIRVSNFFDRIYYLRQRLVSVCFVATKMFIATRQGAGAARGGGVAVAAGRMFTCSWCY